MKYTNVVYVLLAWLISAQPLAEARNISYDDNFGPLYKNLPFNMPMVALPKIPRYEVSIEKFGGVGDGVSVNTGAFAKAINHLSEKGGGRLIVPRGIWLSGPIVLKSHIDLHVQSGALVKFIPDKDLYELIDTSYEGLNAWRPISPIYANNLTDIAITGQGTIDGSGGDWRLVKKSKMTDGQWKKLVASGGIVSDDGKVWFPSQESLQGAKAMKTDNIFKYNKKQAQAIKHWLRPVMVALVNTDRILLDGPTFQNSPAWNLHLLMSQNIVVRNVQVRNPWFAQNGDGIDLESVKNVLVYKNRFDVGDDAICLKSGKNEDGRRRGIPSENLIIQDNVVYHGHGGFVLGSEMSGGVKNVSFSKATFIGTDIGIRFKSTRGRGGVVENIWISDIDMIDIAKGAINFNLYYSNKVLWEPGKKNKDDVPPVDEKTPQFKDISIKNVRALNVGIAAFLQGLPEMKLRNVTLENAYFESNKGIQITDADNINFNNVTVLSQQQNAIDLRNASNVNFGDIDIGKEHHVSIQGEESNDIVFDKKGLKIKMGEYVNEEAVRYSQ